MQTTIEGVEGRVEGLIENRGVLIKSPLVRQCSDNPREYITMKPLGQTIYTFMTFSVKKCAGTSYKWPSQTVATSR